MHSTIIKPVTQKRISAFRRIIYKHYRERGRDLPWRRTDDPYHILVSEIMLQQTQVERVLGKYELFISRFPKVFVLAKASVKEVLSVWQGLGYNKRALALMKIANVITEEYQGVFPRDPQELTRLPAIGRATAGCLLAFAFSIPTAFIETNIRRVFIHHFFKDRAGVHDKEIMPLVEAALDRENPRDWYYALMDYGSALGKRIDNPNKRSFHYSRQSAFENSDRKIRGAILRNLITVESLTRAEICQMFNVEPKRVLRILSDLVMDGFLRKQNELYYFSDKLTKNRAG